MSFLDKKFRDNKGKYALQAFLGGVAVALALTFFDIVNQPAIIASFGASGVLAFTIPKRRISGPRHLIGGYIIGVMVGCTFHFMTIFPLEPYILYKLEHLIAAAVAVGVTMFLMAITNTEHPPSGGIALGLVINDWTPKTVLLVLVGITLISLFQRLLRPYMMDLIESSATEEYYPG